MPRPLGVWMHYAVVFAPAKLKQPRTLRVSGTAGIEPRYHSAEASFNTVAPSTAGAVRMHANAPARHHQTCNVYVTIIVELPRLSLVSSRDTTHRRQTVPRTSQETASERHDHRHQGGACPHMPAQPTPPVPFTSRVHRRDCDPASTPLLARDRASAAGAGLSHRQLSLHHHIDSILNISHVGCLILHVASCFLLRLRT